MRTRDWKMHRFQRRFQRRMQRERRYGMRARGEEEEEEGDVPTRMRKVLGPIAAISLTGLALAQTLRTFPAKSKCPKGKEDEGRRRSGRRGGKRRGGKRKGKGKASQRGRGR